MKYEWTPWMDVLLDGTCPVSVGELVEVDWKMSNGKENKVVFKVEPKDISSWVESSGAYEVHKYLIYWKYRVKRGNIDSMLETTKELEEV